MCACWQLFKAWLLLACTSAQQGDRSLTPGRACLTFTCLPAAALQQRQAEGHSPAPQMQQQQQDRADLLQHLAAYQQDCECLSRKA